MCALDFVRLRFSRAHPYKPELPSAIKCFLNYNQYQSEHFLKQCFCIIEHWIWIWIQ